MDKKLYRIIERFEQEYARNVEEGYEFLGHVYYSVETGKFRFDTASDTEEGQSLITAVLAKIVRELRDE